MNQLPLDQIVCGDALEVMREWPDECIDLIVTDPPYGLGFMGKQWDEATPSIDIWKETLRVLKHGAFAFVMSSPRQDVLCQMISRLSEVGFEMGFTSMYWAYANGFPKAQNISKAIDKRAGAERLSLGKHPNARQTLGAVPICKKDGDGQLRPIPVTPDATALNGSFGGFQPKPAVEVILVAMKPLSEKTFADQALKNGKGVTWLDEGRIPYFNNGKREHKNKYHPSNAIQMFAEEEYEKPSWYEHPSGRFPANLLVSDDVLDDGKINRASKKTRQRTTPHSGGHGKTMGIGWDKEIREIGYDDQGQFSRYFSLDAWWAERVKRLPPEVQKTFPFLIVPKAHKGEKNEGCGKIERKKLPFKGSGYVEGNYTFMNNHHPTVKPVKLMAYLITLGSREGDLILDPFIGSGTTAVASKMLARHYIGVDLKEDYVRISRERLRQISEDLFLTKRY